MLRGKNILIGVCSSIAAYKTAHLIRLLVKQGANVQVVMTSSACSFIAPLTFATLSKNPVLIDFVKNQDSGTWNNHIELGLWAELFVIAPASANSIAKMANGICDNLLLGTYLSARCPVYIAPAMDLDMFKHPATQKNLQTLIAQGKNIIPVEHGELASGLIGEGRMAEPEHILKAIELHFNKKKTPAKVEGKLKGKRVLVSAGPTYEPIDPVRFIGNHSSGKMGIAIANQLIKEGAIVSLVLGPVDKKSHFIDPVIKVMDVHTAHEMYLACIDEYKKVDIAIMSAAVADYTIDKPEVTKIKKKEKTLSIKLRKTQDILATLGKHKKKNQLLVGFALETNNAVPNAKEKLKTKKLDFIVLNSLQDKGAGFKYESNKITILDKYNKTKKFELKHKDEVAQDIIEYLCKFI